MSGREWWTQHRSVSGHHGTTMHVCEEKGGREGRGEEGGGGKRREAGRRQCVCVHVCACV